LSHCRSGFAVALPAADVPTGFYSSRALGADMPQDPGQIKAVFLAALDRVTPAERATFLAEACAGNAALRHRVEALLQAHDQADPLLDRPAAEHLVEEPPSADGARGLQPGAVVADRYKLLEQIGEGGMGTVWVAEQTQPVRRKVALKVIKVGMDSKSVVSRFEAERQALALMDHPNIAKVLDGGTTEGGRPFFVMEYVKGVPLTQYCDEARLSIADRLALFVPVCLAVQHAHQKGIIHRDLKPSNILVCLYDETPVPKVIDFGLAKAIHQPLTEQTVHTAHDMVLGSPLYMSPEQAVFNNLDVDTRSDIYALGVILYELLTGTTPLEKHRFKGTTWEEVLRLIKEEEPPRPSVRLSRTGSLPGVAAQRQAEPVKLKRLVRGELDWIVMKCLEKERARRYETATNFAADINRYLGGEPVLAHPPSASYRLKKFFLRNRMQVIAVGVVLFALIAGFVATTFGLIEARKQEQLARKERDEKETALRGEAEQRRIAETRLAKIDKGVEILGSVFTNLDPRSEEMGGDSLGVALGKQLDRAADELKGDAIGDPLVVAKLQNILGGTLYTLGHHARAVEVLESALATRAAILGADDKDTLRVRTRLCAVYLGIGQTQRAIEMFEHTLPALIQPFGAEDDFVLKSRAQYANALVAGGKNEKATQELVTVLQAYHATGRVDDRSALVATNILAHAYLKAGEFRKAIPLLERILPVCEIKLGIDHLDTLIVRNNLAMGYHQAGEYARCVPLQQRTYEALLVKLGDEHPNTLAARLNLALAKRNAGQLREAVPIYEQLLKIYEAREGPKHSSTLKVSRELGMAYLELGQPERAMPILERTLEIRLSFQKEDEPEVVVARGSLARAYDNAGQYARAIPLYERNLSLAEKKPGIEPDTLIMQRSDLGNALRAAGQFDRAIPTLEGAVKDAEAKLGAEHPMTLRCRGSLAVTYQANEQRARALPLLERNLKISIAKQGEEHPDTVIFRVNLAAALRDNGELAKALPILETSVGQAERAFGTIHPTTLQITQIWLDTLEQTKDWDRVVKGRQSVVAVERQRKKDDSRLAEALSKLGRTFLAAGRAAEAEGPLREAWTIQKRSEPDFWTTFLTQSMLGGALLGQKKHADAEPLLLAGYNGLRQRAAKIPPLRKQLLTDALERLVQCYDASGKPDEAAKWRKDLEKIKTP
jgi:serine/threonine protein kinase/tetratricopeptide (TPR) repeat protein